jgi:hypothetical protein
MYTINQFNTLIQQITNEKIMIHWDNEPIELDCIYTVVSIEKNKDNKHYFEFEFKTPKNIDKLVSSFISQFCSKFKKNLPQFEKYGRNSLGHHRYSKDGLLSIIKDRFMDESFITFYCKYGFYSTNYGIGIYVPYLDIKYLDRMDVFLNNSNIPYKNELSKKEFVYRYVINIDKDYHSILLNKFSF